MHTRFERFYNTCTGRSSENNVAAVEALRKKEIQSETSPLNGNVLFCRFVLNLTLFMTKLRVLVLSFPYFTDYCILLHNR
jgi:hypothetical protein